MSVFKRIFSHSHSHKENKAPNSQEAIQKLLAIEDLLRKRQELLEKKVDEELAMAKANGLKNKRVAIAALKRKKRYELQLNQIDGTLTTLEYQREALENAQTNTKVLKTMGDAAKAFKTAHCEFDVDRVQELKDDIAEQQDLANEIANVISSPISDMDMDENELMSELEELEQEKLDSDLLRLPCAVNDILPNQVSQSDLRSQDRKRSEEEEELNKLLDWAI
jgi:charged multivesicular body protein 4